jgi:acetate kinase
MITASTSLRGHQHWGLTPTGGVIMGTRSGDLDPGVLVYLMREKKFDAAMLEELVDRRSGLASSTIPLVTSEK